MLIYDTKATTSPDKQMHGRERKHIPVHAVSKIYITVYRLYIKKSEFMILVLVFNV